MIKCNKCGGKVMADLSFTSKRDYEAACLICGKRTFVSPSHPQYSIFAKYIKRALYGI